MVEISYSSWMISKREDFLVPSENAADAIVWKVASMEDSPRPSDQDKGEKTRLTIEVTENLLRQDEGDVRESDESLVEEHLQHPAAGDSTGLDFDHSIENESQLVVENASGLPMSELVEGQNSGEDSVPKRGENQDTEHQSSQARITDNGSVIFRDVTSEPELEIPVSSVPEAIYEAEPVFSFLETIHEEQILQDSDDQAVNFITLDLANDRDLTDSEEAAIDTQQDKREDGAVDRLTADSLENPDQESIPDDGDDIQQESVSRLEIETITTADSSDNIAELMNKYSRAEDQSNRDDTAEMNSVLNKTMNGIESGHVRLSHDEDEIQATGSQDHQADFSAPIEQGIGQDDQLSLVDQQEFADDVTADGRLHPSHPLLQGAQQVLRTQLQGQKLALEQEIRERQKTVKVWALPYHLSLIWNFYRHAD